MKRLLIILLLSICSEWVNAQTVEVPFDSPQWETANATVTLQNFEGKSAMLLQSGTIYLKDVAFLNGTIEVDINFSALRNFPGIKFRMVDPQNFEEFYIRPHQSGNPDANQYTPVFNGLPGWQLYHGEKYATPVHYVFNEWHHIKIEVMGSQAKIYYDDMKNPILVVNELLRSPQAGSLGLGTRTNVHFANFKYTPAAQAAPEAAKEQNEIEGLITSWQLAPLQNKGTFQDKTRLTSQDLKDLEWERHEVESSGVLNLARYLQISDEKNAALVKLEIDSERRQLLEFNFGYSDFVKVFVNGAAVYAGATNFRSRDYRYLGTIGFFDTIFLPLKKGDNEVLLVVWENFGGWGLQGKIPDRSSIRIL